MKKSTRLEILYGDGDKSKAFSDVYKEIVPKLCIQYGLPVSLLSDFFEYCMEQDDLRSKHIVHDRFKKRVYKKWERKGGLRCFKCGGSGGLTMHHVRTKNLFPELEWDVGNIVLLCDDCHKKEHNLSYGGKKKPLKELE